MESAMVAHVTVSEARDTLAELLDRVVAGERILIEHHGKPTAVLMSLEELEHLETTAVREAQATYAIELTTKEAEEAPEPYVHPDSVEAHIRRITETGAIEWEGWLGNDVLDVLGITREDIIRALRIPIEEIQDRVGRSLKPGETLAAEIVRMREE